MKGLSIILLLILFSCIKENKNPQIMKITSDYGNIDSLTLLGTYEYQDDLDDKTRINYFKDILKSQYGKRNFDKNFVKYSFPFIKKVDQKNGKLNFYIFKNQYDYAIYGNSSYPFFIDDYKNKIIYYWRGDSIEINQNSFRLFINVRDKVFDTSFSYDNEKKEFEEK